MKTGLDWTLTTQLLGVEKDSDQTDATKMAECFLDIAEMAHGPTHRHPEKVKELKDPARAFFQAYIDFAAGETETKAITAEALKESLSYGSMSELVRLLGNEFMFQRLGGEKGWKMAQTVLGSRPKGLCEASQRRCVWPQDFPILQPPPAPMRSLSTPLFADPAFLPVLVL